MRRYIIIGITDAAQPQLSAEALEAVRAGHVFSGGKRHHEIVRPLLPEGHVWIDIVPPIDAVFEQYKAAPAAPPPNPLPITGRGEYTPHSTDSAIGAPSTPQHSPLPPIGGSWRGAIVVFASGDPLFFGFAGTVLRKDPEAEVRVIAAPNSLQLLAHRLVLPYEDMRCISLVGRDWAALDEALIRGERLVGVLVDRQKRPELVAQRLIDYGYTGYTMSVGERLGGPYERVRTLSLPEAAKSEFEAPCCIILSGLVGATLAVVPPLNNERDGGKPRPYKVWSPQPPSGSPHAGGERRRGWGRGVRPFGIPDHEFALLDGRERMITKMPIRLLSLQALDLPRRHVLWDIGFCTGSISIEARLQFPHLHVVAFEQRPEGAQLMETNSRRFGAPGIEVHIGDFMEAPPAPPPNPLPITGRGLGGGAGGAVDAVFIGGHGGRLAEMMTRIDAVIADGGRVVLNSVTPQSRTTFEQTAQSLGWQLLPPTTIQLNDFNPITILSADVYRSHQ